MLIMKHLKVTFCKSFNIHNIHELAILVPQEVKESTNACRCRFVSSSLYIILSKNKFYKYFLGRTLKPTYINAASFFPLIRIYVSMTAGLSTHSVRVNSRPSSFLYVLMIFNLRPAYNKSSTSQL